MKLWLTDDAWVDTRGDPWQVSWHAGHKCVEPGNVDDLLYKIGLAVADLLAAQEAQHKRASLESDPDEVVAVLHVSVRSDGRDRVYASTGRMVDTGGAAS